MSRSRLVLVIPAALLAIAGISPVSAAAPASPANGLTITANTFALGMTPVDVAASDPSEATSDGALGGCILASGPSLVVGKDGTVGIVTVDHVADGATNQSQGTLSMLPQLSTRRGADRHVVAAACFSADRMAPGDLVTVALRGTDASASFRVLDPRLVVDLAAQRVTGTIPLGPATRHPSILVSGSVPGGDLPRSVVVSTGAAEGEVAIDVPFDGLVEVGPMPTPTPDTDSSILPEVSVSARGLVTLSDRSASFSLIQNVLLYGEPICRLGPAIDRASDPLAMDCAANIDPYTRP